MRMRASLSAGSLAATSAVSLVLVLGAAVGAHAPSASAAPATPVTVWIAGDSTVASSSSAAAVGWGGSFASYFNNVTVQNNAIGGRSIQTWLYEGNVTSTKTSAGECKLSSTAYSSRWTTTLNGMRAGDYLMVQFGINDGDSACPRHVGAARYRELLGVMAQAAKSRGVTPVFLTPPAYIQCSGSTALDNRGFLTDTRTAATANGAALIDLNALSVALYNKLGLCPNNGDYTQGKVGDFFANDHTHFSASGAQQIAAAIADDIRRQKLGLAQYLRTNPTTTSAPPTSVPPTSVRPTSTPPTSVPPTSVRPTSTPPTSVPPTTARPTSTSPRPSTTPAAPSTTPAAPTTGSGSTGNCSATFTVTNAWGSGFQGDVAISRTASSTAGWTATITLAPGQTVRQLWGGVTSTSATNSVVVKNESWNGNLGQAGASFGLLIDGPATAPVVGCSVS